MTKNAIQICAKQDQCRLVNIKSKSTQLLVEPNQELHHQPHSLNQCRVFLHMSCKYSFTACSSLVSINSPTHCSWKRQRISQKCYCGNQLASDADVKKHQLLSSFICTCICYSFVKELDVYQFKCPNCFE